MPQNVTWNGVTYPIPLAGELNWASLSTFLIDLGTYAAVAQEAKQTIRVAVSSPVTVAAATDYAVITDLTVPGAVAVTLPAGVAGQIFVIVDGKGDAATNNITITPNGAETIKGAANLVLNKNRQSVFLGYDLGTTDWKLLDYSIPLGGVTPSDITGIVTPDQGGTGVANNPASTLTLTGAFPLDLTLGASTSLTLPAAGTVATLAGTETLSNKTLDTPILSSYEDCTEISTPANPSAGTLRVYSKSDDKLYTLNSTGIETPLGSGTSSAFNGNVRAPEGGGTVTLTIADKQAQRFDLTAAEVVILPTTGVSQGDIYQMVNPNPFQLQIQASDASLILNSWGSEVALIALVNTPVASTDWAVIRHTVLFGRFWQTYSLPTSAGTGITSSFAKWIRTGIDSITVYMQIVFSGTNSVSTPFYAACPNYFSANPGDYPQGSAIALGSVWYLGPSSHVYSGAVVPGLATVVNANDAFGFYLGYGAGNFGGPEILALPGNGTTSGDILGCQFTFRAIQLPEA